MSYCLFILLTIIVFINFKRFYSAQEQQPFFIFFVFSVTILYTPIIYYLIGQGSSYRNFSDSALDTFQLISIGIFLLMFCADVIAAELTSKDRMVYLREKLLHKESLTPKKATLFKIFLYVLTGFICLYICFHLESFTLVKLISGASLTARSDTTGDLPHWFTMYLLISIFIPILYFYTTKKKSLTVQITGCLCVLLFLMIDGNKGLVFTFCLYILLFKFKNVISLKTFLLLLISVLIYLFLMSGSFMINDENTQHLSGAFRRTFVTQGAGIPNRIEMKDQGFDFHSGTRVAEDVFQYIYGYTGGAHPTFFIIDIGIQYGFPFMFLVGGIAMLVLTVLSRKIFYLHNRDDFFYWCYAYMAFCCSMSEISKLENWYRYIFIFTLIFFYRQYIKRISTPV